MRARLSGTAKTPRLCVFRANKHIYAQLIDDEKRKTILSVSDLKLRTKEIKSEGKLKGKILIAFAVGQLIAQKALEKKMKKVVFDRGGYKYHGRVKALAEGARQAGLEF